ncbi:autotransporter-associated beta strand repeat-containing protein [Roseateles agri]|nr:autotransporter-associated beta strand repeat-containing protein [Paucibacter sp. R3-3]
MNRQTTRRPRLKLLALAACLVGAPGLSFATPQGGTVVYGQATLQSRPNGLDIQQGTSKAIIDWNSFSVASGEIVRIDQPSASAVLLNRVIGDNPSTILGQIQANGRVFLLNPRGILLGAGSRIDTGSFLASTLNLSNEDFLAGRIQLDAGAATPGLLQADGAISAPGGTIALVSPQLTVTGTLEAQRVGLAAASSVRVDVEGDGLIFFDVRNDNLAARLQMLGTLKADGGTAELRAQARAGFADTVLNMDGIVQARSLGVKNGKVVIDGGSDGVTSIAGRVDVSGSGAGEHGGSATILGDKLALSGSIDANGMAGGGSIELGGGFHGEGTEHNASKTWVTSTARLTADALDKGDGGTVVVWSEDATNYYGQLSARGGPQGGNGGSAEVSGRQFLNFVGDADLLAPLGRTGSLLLDPLNLTIGSVANLDGTAPPANDLTGNTVNWFDFNGVNSQITAATVQARLANADLLLEATNNITVSTAINVASGSHSLTLQAGNNIAVSTPISVKGDLVLSANHTFTSNGGSAASGTGGISFTGTASLAGANITLEGTGAMALPAITATGGAISVTTTGNITQTGALSVGAQNSSFTTTGSGATITLGGANLFGANSVAFNSGGLTTVSADRLNIGQSEVGALSATATGTTGIGQSGAITIHGASSFIASAAGATITLPGANVFGANAVSFTSAGLTTVWADQLNFGLTDVGSLSATATGAVGIGQGAGITIHGASSFTANTTTGAAIALGGTNAFGANAVRFNSDGATTVSADQLNFGLTNVGSLAATATGSTGIGQTDAITIHGASSFNAPAITLSGTNAFGANAVRFSSSGATSVSADQLNFDLTNVGSLSATATGTTGIGQTGAITIHGASSFDAAAIMLSGANAFGANAVRFTSGGATTVSADQLNFDTSNVGSLTASGTTSIGQTGAITIHGASSFSAATITLSGANVFGANAVAFTSSGTTTVSADQLNFDTSQIGTTLQATTTSGGISESGAVTTGASGSNFSVAAGQSIDLSTQANSLAGLASGGDTFTTHGDLALRNVGGIQVPAAATNLPGKLVLTSDTGSISQVAAFSVGADGSTFTTSATNQTITLTQANLLNGHTVSLNTNTSNSADSASLTAEAIKLADSNVGGPLILTANTGAITQTAALTLHTDGSRFTTSGTNQAILLTQDNVFNGKTVELHSSGDTTIKADAIKLAASTIGGKLMATATGGDITETGAIQLGADGSSFGASGAIDLSTSTNLFGTHDLAFTSGGNVAVKSATLKLAASNIGGKLTATATGGDITETGVIQLGAGSSSFGASGAIDLSTSTNQFGTHDVAFTSGGNVAVKSDSLTFDASTIGGKLTATATGGNIAETGVIQLGANGSTFGASGSIDLSTSTNVFGGFDTVFSSSGATKVSADRLNFGTSNVGSLVATATGTTGISQTGAITIHGDSSFTANGTGATIALSGNNAFGTNAVAFASNRTTTINADALKFATSQIGTTLQATTTSGGISESGGVTTGASGSSFTVAAGQSIDLSTQANSLAGLAAGGDTFTTHGDLALRNVGSIQMPAAATSLPGKLVLISDTGSISQLGAFSVGADGSTFTTSAANQAITLTQANLLNGHTVSLNTSGGNASLTADAIKLAASDVDGQLTLSANTGAITQTAALTLRADGSKFTTTGTNQAILLTQANVFNGKTIELHSSGDTSVKADAIKLAASTVGGKLTATATAGSITETGAIQLGADGSSFSASGAIDLSTSTNLFGTHDLAFTSGGNVAVKSATLKLAASNIGGKLTATATGGDITETGVIQLGSDGSSFGASGAIDLSTSTNQFGTHDVAFSSGGNVAVKSDSLTLAASTIGGKLTATAVSGAIAQTGALSLGADGSLFTTSGAGRAIALTQANLFGGKSIAFSTNGGDVSVKADVLYFGASTIGGKLVANATAGNIGQAGTLSVGADGSSLTASQAIALTLANQFGGHTVALNSGGDTVLTADAFGLAGGTIGGKLTAIASTGSIGQTGALTLGADGSSFSAAQDISLTAANVLNGKTVTLSSGGDSALTGDAIVLAASSVGGKLVLDASTGGITQTGALTLGADGSSFSAAQAIVLDQVGNVFGGKSLALASGGDVTLAGDAITLGTSSIGGKLVVNASGAITQTAALTLNADGNSFTGSSITLDQANVLNGKTIALNTAGDATLAGDHILLSASTIGGALNLQAAGSIAQGGTLTIGGLSTLSSAGTAATVVLTDTANQYGSGVQLSGTTPFQSATLSGTGTLTVGGNAVLLNLSGDGPLVLTGGSYTTLNLASGRGISQLGAISVSGDLTLTATGSAPLDANLGTADNDLNTARLAAGGPGFGSVSLRDVDTRADGLVVSGDAAQLSLVALGGVTLAGGHYGTLGVETDGGNIGQSGALQVDGLSTLNAGSGDIVLDTVANDFATIALPAAAHVTLVDANDMTLTEAHVSDTLSVSLPGTAQFSGDFTGTALLVKQGSGVLIVGTGLGNLGGTDLQSGTLVLSGASAHLGPGTLTLGPAGTLELRDGADFSNALLADGGLIRGASGSSRIDGALTLGADTIFEVGSGASLQLAGAVAETGGARSLTKTGDGLLQLSGSDTRHGATLVNAGTLLADGALSANSALTLVTGTLLQLGADQTIGSLAGSGRVALGSFRLAAGADQSSTTFSGSIDGSGGLTKLGSGTLTLSGTNTQSGTTLLQAGTLVLAGGQAQADGTALDISTGATLNLAGDETIGALLGSGAVTLGDARLTVDTSVQDGAFAGSITGAAGGVTKAGTGTLTLSGTGDWRGETRVDAGRLLLAGVNALPVNTTLNVAAGASLSTGQALALSALNGAGTVELSNASTLLTIGAGGADSAFAGSITGSGGLAKTGTGTLLLSGTNSFTGAVAIDAGTLQLSGGAALADTAQVALAAGARLNLLADETIASLTGPGQAQLDNGARLALGGDGADSLFAGTLIGSGGLTKQGAGTLTLTGDNTYAGGTLIEAGTLQIGSGGANATSGSLGSGAVDDRGLLRFARSDAVSLDNAVTGSGGLELTQGQLTLGSTQNAYAGTTQVSGGALLTAGAERLPDASAVNVAAGATLTLAGNETIASLSADGAVTVNGNVTTAAGQRYGGGLIIASATPITLQAGGALEALQSSNQLGSQPLNISADSVQLMAPQDLTLGTVQLANGGQISAEHLTLQGTLTQTGGTLALVARAAPDAAKAEATPTAVIPLTDKSLAFAETTLTQGDGSILNIAEGATLTVSALGSINLNQESNQIAGGVQVLSGAAFNTAWSANVQGNVGIQSIVKLAGQQLNIAGSGIEADVIEISAAKLATTGSSVIAARLPYDNVAAGTTLSQPGLLLNLLPGAFDQGFSFGAGGDAGIHVSIGARSIGNRTDGPDSGFLTVRPLAGAQGSTAIFLLGPESGAGGYSLFHDGAGKSGEIPVFYNNVLPAVPQLTSALSSVTAVSESSRRDRFEEAVRTENVTVRLRSGVIAEVGPGRAATTGSGGVQAPPSCENSSCNP